MKGTEIHYREGRRFAITHERLRARIPAADPKHGNPKLWWMEEITPSNRDWIGCGMKTKRECLDLIEEQLTDKEGR